MLLCIQYRVISAHIITGPRCPHKVFSIFFTWLVNLVHWYIYSLKDERSQHKSTWNRRDQLFSNDDTRKIQLGCYVSWFIRICGVYLMNIRPVVLYPFMTHQATRCSTYFTLTYGDLNMKADILQKTFSSTFRWKNVLHFDSNFTQFFFFLIVQLIINHYWFR